MIEKKEEFRVCFVYIVQCRDGSLYTGWTIDLIKRIAKHNEGKGAKYTRSRCPVTLVYTERHNNKNEAMSREKLIQRLTREDKLKLINNTDTPVIIN